MSEAPEAAGTTPSLVGQVLDGRYRLTKKLGEGGMGEVYAADHVHIEKHFAIKLLRPEIVSNQEAVKRFYQEARSSSSIGHRNIIGIEDFGQLPDGRVYMCMELLNGAPLNDMLMGAPMPVDRLLNILIQTGHGLAAAHAKGIVHRDMKPENIYVTVGPNGEDIPKLLDFGIAKVSGNDGQNNLTRTGTIFGTPFYMAPEQALGNPVDQRTDIYAVGVIMYEVFAGSLPFQGESFMGILTQHITTEPEPVDQRAAKAGRQIPPELSAIITRCTRKNPAERFASMDELVNALVAVYRTMAGAGMSTYMEAFAHPPSQTPGAMQRPTGNLGPGSAPAMNATMMAGTPPPGMPGGMPPSGQHAAVAPQQPMGQSQPIGAVSGSSGLYNPNASSVTSEPKKGGKGLLIAIIALVVVGGGVAAAVVVLGNKDNVATGSGSGSQVAMADPKGIDPKPTDPKPTDPKPTDPKPTDPKPADPKPTDPKPADPKPGDPKTVGSAGSAEDPKATVDAGVAEVKPPVDAPAAVVPAPDSKRVILSARNVSAFEVWENGAKIGDGPMDLDVPANGKRTVTIKAKGFKDRQMVVDSKGKSVQFSMDRVISTVPLPHDGSNANHPPPPPPPPPQVNCSNAVVDPKNPACIKQYCAIHKSDLRCDAM